MSVLSRGMSLLAFGGLLGPTLASPVDTFSSPRGPSLVSRQSGEVLNNVDSWCYNNNDSSTWEAVQGTYGRVGIPIVLEKLMEVAGTDEEGWLQAVEQELFPKTDSDGRAHCAQLTGNGECQVGKDWDCDEYFELVSDRADFRWAYWVFRAVRGAHNKLGMMKAAIHEGTTIGSLQITSLFKDLEADISEELSSSDVTGWLSTMFSVASAPGGVAALGPNPVGPTVAGTASSVMGTLLSAAAGAMEDDEEEDALVKLGDIEKWLSEYFEDAVKDLETTASLAVGVKHGEKGFNDLPSMWRKTTNKDFEGVETNVGKFYSTPFWLLDADANILKDVVEVIRRNVRWKLIDIVLQTNDAVVMGDDTIDSKEECDDVPGGRWINHREDKWDCVNLWWKVDANHMEYQKPRSNDYFKKLEDADFADLEDYYYGAIKCAEADKAGKNEMVGDLDKLLKNDLPLCFFSPEVKWHWTVQRSGDCDGGNFQPHCGMPDDSKFKDWFPL